MRAVGRVENVPAGPHPVRRWEAGLDLAHQDIGGAIDRPRDRVDRRNATPQGSEDLKPLAGGRGVDQVDEVHQIVSVLSARGGEQNLGLMSEFREGGQEVSGVGRDT